MRPIQLAVLAVFATFAWAQDGERIVVPLSDPSRPATLRANLMSGRISVKGYAGKEVIIEARGRGEKRSKPTSEEAGGMHRIEMRGMGFEAEERDNVVRISGGLSSHLDIEVQLPANSSVNLESVNNALAVEGISGEIDLNTVNGGITVGNVSGPVLAHCVNGTIKVDFTSIPQGKPMSFSTLNGTIDVTLPAETKANLKLKTENGDVFTDFDVTVKSGPGGQSERSGGGFKIKFDKGLYGTINGGGPEMQFTTMNGKIYIRKRK
jgi:hypothetical protein